MEFKTYVDLLLAAMFFIAGWWFGINAIRQLRYNSTLMVKFDNDGNHIFYTFSFCRWWDATYLYESVNLASYLAKFEPTTKRRWLSTIRDTHGKRFQQIQKIKIDVSNCSKETLCELIMKYKPLYQLLDNSDPSLKQFYKTVWSL